jgi:hypothetical protein
MNAPHVVVLATIAISLIIGVVEYHHVLDPSRAEHDGVTLNLLVDRGNGEVPNDWYTAGGARVTASNGEVQIVPHVDGWGLESRIVHLSANDCYRVDVRGYAKGGAAVLAAYDAELTRFGSYTPLSATMRTASFFVSAPDQRTTLAVAATSGAHITLAGVRLQRLSRSCKMPRTGHDIGKVLNRLLKS